MNLIQSPKTAGKVEILIGSTGQPPPPPQSSTKYNTELSLSMNKKQNSDVQLYLNPILSQ
jgi:hypothetical protein